MNSKKTGLCSRRRLELLLGALIVLHFIVIWSIIFSNSKHPFEEERHLQDLKYVQPSNPIQESITENTQIPAEQSSTQHRIDGSVKYNLEDLQEQHKSQSTLLNPDLQSSLKVQGKGKIILTGKQPSEQAHKEKVEILQKKKERESSYQQRDFEHSQEKYEDKQEKKQTDQLDTKENPNLIWNQVQPQHKTTQAASNMELYPLYPDNSEIIPPISTPKQRLQLPTSRPPFWKPYRSLDQLLEAWTNGKFDWHYLVPQILAHGESGGCCSTLSIVDIVRKQSSTMSHLLESRDIKRVGPIDLVDFNPDYRHCRHLNDKCVIHRNQGECIDDGFCHWCESAHICVERNPLQPADIGSKDSSYFSLCPDLVEVAIKKKNGIALPGDDLLVLESSLRAGLSGIRDFKVSSSMVGQRAKWVRWKSGTLESFGSINVNVGSINWKRNEKQLDLLQDCPSGIIRGTTFFLKFHQENMYWHLIHDYMFGLLSKTNNNPANNHFVFMGEHNEASFDWFSVMTKSCWRYSNKLQDGLCFEEVSIGEAGSGSSLSWVSHIVDRLNLQSWPDGKSKSSPIVGIVSRVDKRIILNELELAKAAQDMGCEVKLLKWEIMPIEEQVAAAREIDIIVGVHGSGLLNVIFMRPNTVEIQIVPFGLDSSPGITSVYGSVASQHQVRYLELKNQVPSHSVLHFHFMDDIWPDKIKYGKGTGGFTREDIYTRGGAVLTEPQARVLLIQQDSIIPVGDFKKAIKQAIDLLH